MNILSKIYEVLFVSKDVRKLCDAYRSGKLKIVEHHYRQDSYGRIHQHAYVIFGVVDVKNSLKVYNDDSVIVIKNGEEGDCVYTKKYNRLFELAHSDHRAKKKATRLDAKKKALAQLEADVNEIFADILKG